jgi:hypothetical protein
MTMPRTSNYYRRYAQELRAIANRRRTYEGLLATLDLAKTYDQMADQMAEAEKTMSDDHPLLITDESRISEKYKR